MSRQSVIRGLKESINVLCVREAADPCLQTLVVGELVLGDAGALHTELALAVEDNRGFGTAVLSGCSAGEQVTWWPGLP